MENKESKIKHNFKSASKWKKALSAAPHSSWIKERSLGSGRKSVYIPTEHKESLIDIFFDEFNIIDLKLEVVVNEITCIVKIQYLPSYPKAEYRIVCGVAAKAIQCASGSTAHRFPRLKITNALEYNTPAAKTAAIGNALASIGNVFGRNLNRGVDDNYNFLDRMGSKKTKKKNKKKKK